MSSTTLHRIMMISTCLMQFGPAEGVVGGGGLVGCGGREGEGGGEGLMVGAGGGELGREGGQGALISTLLLNKDK